MSSVYFEFDIIVIKNCSIINNHIFDIQLKSTFLESGFFNYLYNTILKITKFEHY